MLTFFSMTQISGCMPKATVTEFDNTETQASLSLLLPPTYIDLIIPTLCYDGSTAEASFISSKQNSSAEEHVIASGSLRLSSHL